MNQEKEPKLPITPKTGPWDVTQCTVDCGGKGRTFFDTPLGRQVFKDVLTGHSYPLHSSFGEINTILDIGANVGAATIFFASTTRTPALWRSSRHLSATPCLFAIPNG